MTTTPSTSRRSTSLSHLLAAAALLATAPLVHAQYKVVDTDGKVTYTDRAPNTNDGRVTALGARAPLGTPEPELPFELRQVATKYPVTLYTTTGVCDACVAGRQLLSQRGVPYTERQAVTSEDVDALEKLSGGRDAPTLTIGSQVLRGLAHDTWNQYLDAAGYPRESKLPSGYQQRPIAAIVERREQPVARNDVAQPTVRRSAPAPAAPPASGIRF
ncbi:MAG TPA: glutaredoxin family protein [Caldimonas sp.]|jgi:glutaredoxin|nr:glutaredoxin family protein [Caldimonas sp.]HEX4236281.1 glutaredoxin family protein [Caldimonas sp.]